MFKEQQNKPESMRLDKWLWCARFYKTRKLALDAIKSGKIKQDNNRIKPSRSVCPGEIYSIRRGMIIQIVTVLSLSSQRRAATEARLLYQENEESIKQRQTLLLQLKINNDNLPRSTGRPGTRDRRKIIKFTQHNG
jgi:ribosome-associated heat shock protein Hsp15